MSELRPSVVRGLRLRLLPLVGVLLLFPTGSATAVSRKIAIGDFRWSEQTVAIDRGESVTWHWIGPDTQHSITELSPLPGRIDSDPGGLVPQHEVGDRFRFQFNAPGTYRLHCKIHAVVAGSVVVSDRPGDPVSDPDPDPLSYVDRRPPELTKVKVVPRSGLQAFTFLGFTLDEVGTVEVDLYRLKGRRGIDYLGLRHFSAHIGLNEIRIDPRKIGKRPLRPGRYRAEVRALDGASNASGQRVVGFQIGSRKT